MAGVTLEDVRKVYAGEVEAVKGVSLDIPDGSFCVLVGPSGCGKSTLLRMVAGLETISAGTVRIGERVVNEIEPSERDIAMVFQNYALYPHMSVYDNMAYGLRNRRTPKDEIDKRVREAARILAIEPFLDRKPRQLSGGQRQRVAMGRAIVRKPQVFLFDEPLSNLDAKLRVQMRVEIKRLQRALGVTVDLRHARPGRGDDAVRQARRHERRADRAGRHARPRSTAGRETRFVATFIGSPPMNILPGRVEGPGRVSVGGQTLPVADMRDGLAAGHGGRGRPAARGRPRWPPLGRHARPWRSISSRNSARRSSSTASSAGASSSSRPRPARSSPRPAGSRSRSTRRTCTCSIRRRRSGSGRI